MNWRVSLHRKNGIPYISKRLRTYLCMRSASNAKTMHVCGTLRAVYNFEKWPGICQACHNEGEFISEIAFWIIIFQEHFLSLPSACGWAKLLRTEIGGRFYFIFVIVVHLSSNCFFGAFLSILEVYGRLVNFIDEFFDEIFDEFFDDFFSFNDCKL